MVLKSIYPFKFNRLFAISIALSDNSLIPLAPTQLCSCCDLHSLRNKNLHIVLGNVSKMPKN